jgi:hypothetical protein
MESTWPPMRSMRATNFCFSFQDVTLLTNNGGARWFCLTLFS